MFFLSFCLIAVTLFRSPLHARGQTSPARLAQLEAATLKAEEEAAAARDYAMRVLREKGVLPAGATVADFSQTQEAKLAAAAREAQTAAERQSSAAHYAAELTAAQKALEQATADAKKEASYAAANKLRIAAADARVRTAKAYAAQQSAAASRARFAVDAAMSSFVASERAAADANALVACPTADNTPRLVPIEAHSDDSAFLESQAATCAHAQRLLMLRLRSAKVPIF